MKDTKLNELAKRAYENAKVKGFHDVELADGHFLMLVICELAEAVEADREGRRADRQTYEFLLADYGEHLREHLFEMHIKDTVEDELADAVIRMLDFIGMKGIDIERRLKRLEFQTGKGSEMGKQRVLTEEIFSIISRFCFDEYIDFLMLDLFDLAGKQNVDLMWFVNEKMMYNEKRGWRHGKQY